MKKLFLFLSVFFFLQTFFVSVFAISPSPIDSAISPTANPKTPLEDQNALKQNFLDKIASRVAELRLVEKRGIEGTVSQVSDTQVTVTDIKGDIRFVDVDELTKFASPSAKTSFGISDIAKGAKISVIGLYNKQSRRILARFIDVVVTPQMLSGIIDTIDPKNFTFSLLTQDGKTYKVDVENITKTLAYSDGSLSRFGFSKLSENQNIFVIGFADKKNKSNIIASRILVFPDIPKNPRIQKIQKAIEPQETIIPSTGSGKKLTPLR